MQPTTDARNQTLADFKNALLAWQEAERRQEWLHRTVTEHQTELSRVTSEQMRLHRRLDVCANNAGISDGIVRIGDTIIYYRKDYKPLVLPETVLP